MEGALSEPEIRRRQRFPGFPRSGCLRRNSRRFMHHPAGPASADYTEGALGLLPLRFHRHRTGHPTSVPSYGRSVDLPGTLYRAG